MTRIRMVGLALVAAFAFAALAGTASAAGPEWYTKTVIGQTAQDVSFTATLGAAFLEGKSGTKITCTGGSGSGETSGPTAVKNNITTFTGCEVGGAPCENSGPGTIKTKVLAGSLGNVVAKKTPGIRLFDEVEGKGGKLATFSCASGTIAVVVKGSVIGSLSGASGVDAAHGKFAASNKLTFAEAAGIQKYTKFIAGEGEAGEEQLESSVGGGAFEKSGQSVIATLKSVPASNLNSTL